MESSRTRSYENLLLDGSLQASHVVIVCDLLSTFYRFRRFLALRMIEQGHCVTVIASSDDLTNHDFFEEHSIGLEVVRMRRTGLNPVSDYLYGRRLLRVLRVLRPSHLLAYQAKAAVWTAIAGRQLNNCHVSVLFPGLGYLFSPADNVKHRLVQFVSQRLYRYAFRGVQTAFFQNPDDQQLLADLGIIRGDTNSVLVNGSGVDLDGFPFSTVCLTPIRFGMATRLLADKGIREFVDVACELSVQYGDRVDFVVAGGLDSNPTAISKREIESWRSKGGPRYLGSVDDMTKFYRECSVFVLPSYYMEGTPRSILEAMSSGRPIVTTDNRGCKETVEDGVNGYLVEQRCRRSLRDAFVRMIESPGSLAAMGRESRGIAEEKYDVQRVCEKMLTAMELRGSDRTESSEVDQMASRS